MNDTKLDGCRLVILAGPLYEDIEVHYPRIRLQEEGATVLVAGFDESVYRDIFWSLALASRGRADIAGFDGRVYKGIHGMPIAADTIVEELDPDTVDGLIIPGGYSADHQRRSEAVLAFCQTVLKRGRPVAAICHGPWVLASAGLLDGRRVTGHPVIRGDVVGAGGIWSDEECVIDGPVITARFPDDLGQFCRAIVRECLAARAEP